MYEEMFGKMYDGEQINVCTGNDSVCEWEQVNVCVRGCKVCEGM